MTFRAKLLALVAGATTLPLLFIGFTFYLRGVNARNAGSGPVGSFVRLMDWTENQLPALWSKGVPGQAERTLPAGAEVLVADTHGRVIFSRIPGIGGGDKPLFEKLLDALRNTDDRARLEIVPVFTEGGAGREDALAGLMVHRHPPPPGPLSILAMRLEGPLTYMGFVVLASSLLIVLLTRSLQNGVRRLQAASARVASGELEFELQARGRDELAVLTRSFESMRRALREEREARSRFLMAVSHDLKTPLTVIKGYLEAIEDGMAEDPQTLGSHVAIIQQKSGLLEERINELIDYVKMSTGQWQLRHRPIAARLFLTRLGKSFAADAQIFRRGFESRIDLPAEQTLLGDEGLLTRAMDNLFHNALRYTREGDTIRLLAWREGKTAVIAFEDTGPGVARDELERIFEPFYRGTNSRRETGSGLGLSTVRSIFGAHGWTIRAASLPGQGLRFLIRIEDGARPAPA